MAGGAFTADFLFSIEKRMRNLNERGYMAMLASENSWAQKLLKLDPLDGKSKRATWLLSTASIEQLSPNDGGENGGALNFDELASVTAEYFPAYHARGYKIGKIKLQNMMNGGLDPAAKWAQDIGTYGAYYPQRLLAQVLLNGENALGYDGVNFFSTSHPVHPLIPGLGTYANLFTGAASGSYPGALPIDDSVTVSQAFINLSAGLSYIAGYIPMPNGAGDPRFLVPEYLLHPTRMRSQVAQILDANFIAQAASGGAGAGDVKAYWKKWRLMEPIEAKELNGGRSYTFPGPAGTPVTVTGDDKTYYVVCREANESELGAYLWTLRQAFALHTYTGDSGTAGVDAVLGRSQDLEWHYDSWQSVNQGHPFTIFKFKGA